MNKRIWLALGICLCMLSMHAACAEDDMVGTQIQSMDDLQYGDIVTIGCFEQDNNLENGPEPIEWTIIKVEKNDIVLLSKYVLDTRAWRGLDTWLNDVFFEGAFSNAEQRGINWNYFEFANQRIGSLRGVDAEECFEAEHQRRAKATAYAQSRGALVDENGYCPWWINVGGERSAMNTCIIRATGSTDEAEINAQGIGVRPTIRVPMKNLQILDSVLRFEQKHAELEEEQTWVCPPQYAVGNIVTFGQYEQDNRQSNGKEPIEWIVLAHDDRNALLTSRHGLDVKRYHEKREPVTWESCTLRDWLNDDFFHTAFDAMQQDAIVLSLIHSNVGNDVMDKVFILSVEEADSYFKNEEARRIGSTKYARKKGAYDDGNIRAYWWTRTRADHEDGVYLFGVVGEQASIDNKWYWECGYYDYPGNVDQVTVRPAIWIDIEKAVQGSANIAGDDPVSGQGNVRILGNGTVNVREKSNADSKRVGRVHTGEEYPCLSIASNGWFEIMLKDGVTGFVSGKMAEMIR